MYLPETFYPLIQTCPICDKPFWPGRSVCKNDHILLHHKLKKKAFMCNECGYSCSVRQVFMAHQISQHQRVNEDPNNHLASLDLAFRKLRKCSICRYQTVEYNKCLYHEYSTHIPLWKNYYETFKKGINSNGMQPRSLLHMSAEVVNRSGMYEELTGADVPQSLLKVIKDSCGTYTE